VAPAGARLEIAIAPLAFAGAPEQAVTVRFNGERVLDRHTLTEGWQTIAANVPAGVTRRGANRAQLEFRWTASPRDVFPDAGSRAEIGATGAVSPVNIDVRSFNEAFISIFGHEGEKRNGLGARIGRHSWCGAG
jgi:hypothetical protein